MKKKISILFFILSAFLTGIQDADAQESNSLSSKRLSVGLNSDAFAGLELGYLQELSILSIPSRYYIKLNVPLLSSVEQKKLDTWEIKVGVTIDLLKSKDFLFLTDVNLFSIKHTQALGTFLPFGINLKLTPAYRTKNGYIGIQAMFKQTMFTYIRHSEYVKERFSEIYDSNNNLIETQAQNGFYLFTGNHLYYGIEGMFSLSNKLDLYFDLGLIDYISKYTGFFDSMMFGQIPFYTNVQLNYLIGKN